MRENLEGGARTLQRVAKMANPFRAGCRLKSLDVDVGRRADIRAKYPFIKNANTAILFAGTTPGAVGDLLILVTFGGSTSQLRVVSGTGNGWLRLTVHKWHRKVEVEWAITTHFESCDDVHVPLVSIAFGGVLGVLMRSHIPPYRQAMWDQLMSHLRRQMTCRYDVTGSDDVFTSKSMYALASSAREHVLRLSLRALREACREAASRRCELVLRLAHWR